MFKFKAGQIVYSTGVCYKVESSKLSDCGLVFCTLVPICPAMDHYVVIEQETLARANDEHTRRLKLSVRKG